MNRSTSQSPAADERLKTSEYIGYALGDTASNFFFQTFNIFLTYYYVDVWGLFRDCAVVDDAHRSPHRLLLMIRSWA